MRIRRTNQPPAAFEAGRVGIGLLAAGPAGEPRIVSALEARQAIAAGQGDGNGDVSGPDVSVDSEVVLFDGTTGKSLKRAAITGLAKLVAGVLSAAVAAVDYVAPGLITASGLTMATGRLLGRTTAATGAIEEITPGTGIGLAATTLSLTGVLPVLTADPTLVNDTAWIFRDGATPQTVSIKVRIGGVTTTFPLGETA